MINKIFCFDAIFTKPLTGISVGNLLTIAEKTLEALNLIEEDITIYGVTADVITDFENLISEFHSLFTRQVKETRALNNSTYERSELRKEAFLLLEHVADIGRTYWKKQDPAKSMDYIIRKKKTPAAKTQSVDDDF